LFLLWNECFRPACWSGILERYAHLKKLVARVHIALLPWMAALLKPANGLASTVKTIFKA
jgi:hypothetical protein